MFRRLGHRRGAGWALYNLAWLDRDAAKPRQARTLLAEANAAFQVDGFGPGLTACALAAARLDLDDAPERVTQWADGDDRIRYISSIDRQRAARVRRFVGAVRSA